MTQYVTFAPFYGGGWQDNPSTATPIIAAALQNWDTALTQLFGAVTMGGIFGNAADGSLTFDGSSTVAGLVPSSSTYTLTRNLHATSVTVNPGVTVKMASYRMHGQGTLTNNGTISNAGLNATGQLGASGVSATYIFGRPGGNGGTGVNGGGVAGTNSNWGTGGGSGGAGTSGTAGAGGTSTQTSATLAANVLDTPYPALGPTVTYANSTLPLSGGAGGGGGGADAAGNNGGGGGTGGGFMGLFFWAIVNNGTFTVIGGNGFTPAVGNAGGGGGGGGGFIYGCTLSAWTPGTLTVAGGTPGNGIGTGAAGVAGNAGGSLNLVLA